MVTYSVDIHVPVTVIDVREAVSICRAGLHAAEHCFVAILAWRNVQSPVHPAHHNVVIIAITKFADGAVVILVGNALRSAYGSVHIINVLNLAERFAIDRDATSHAPGCYRVAICVLVFAVTFALTYAEFAM